MPTTAATSQQTSQGTSQETSPNGVTLGTQQQQTATTQQTTTSQGSEGGSGGEQKPWYDGLVKDADNLKIMQTAKWADGDAMLKSYAELQTKLSSSRPATQAPSDPKEYKFEVPTDLGKAYDMKFQDGFRQWAHKAGLSQEQAGGLHDAYVGFFKSTMAGQSQSATEALEQSVASSMGALTKAWGQMGTPAFNRSLEMAKRAMSHLDPNLAQELRDVGAVVKVGNEEMIAKPALFLALSKAGQNMFAEDNLFGDKTSTVNPFDPKTEDRAAQGRLFKNDPDKAELLIRAAGPATENLFSHWLDERRSKRAG